MEPFIGEIKMFGGTFAPKGYAFCDGSLLNISQWTALFSLLGTTYGGNGTTNFALPDLRGRVPVHQGQGPGRSPYVLGEVGGAEAVTLTTTQMPAHTHSATATVTLNANGDRATASSPAGAVPAGTPANAYASRADGTTTMNAGAATAIVSNAVVGGGLPVATLPPFQCVSFIIALEGVFPSRN